MPLIFVICLFFFGPFLAILHKSKLGLVSWEELSGAPLRELRARAGGDGPDGTAGLPSGLCLGADPGGYFCMSPSFKK